MCIAAAALVGFFVADPMRNSSVVIVGGLIGVMAWPLLVRWHRMLLVGSLHSVFVLQFLPGNLPAWCGLAAIGFLIVILNRCLSRDVKLIHPGGVAWSLIAIVAAVALTVWVRGGVGIKALGSDSYGGKKYIFLLLGVAAYFVLVARPIPRSQVKFHLCLFLLSGLTAILSHLVFMAGTTFHPLFYFISSEAAYSQAAFNMQFGGDSVFRSTAFAEAAGGIITLLLALKGLRGILDVRKPWFLLLTLLCLVLGMVGGFRSFLLSMMVSFTFFFFIEGLHRTKLVAVMVAVGMVCGIGLVAFSEKLPITIQRSLTFLPLKLDEWVRQDAQGSLDWRIEMWGTLQREVPENLMLGKGYSIDPDAMRMSMFNSVQDFGLKSEWAMLTGEYHNGPLSVLIPFGIWGALAFVWFLVASALRLRWHCRNCDPSMLNINRAFFVFFVVRSIFFVFLIGSLYSGLVEFVFLIGLAEAMNAQPKPDETEPAMAQEDSGASVSHEI